MDLDLDNGNRLPDPLLIDGRDVADQALEKPFQVGHVPLVTK